MFIVVGGIGERYRVKYRRGFCRGDISTRVGLVKRGGRCRG